MNRARYKGESYKDYKISLANEQYRLDTINRGWVFYPSRKGGSPYINPDLKVTRAIKRRMK